jgi:hypothetical protein
LPKNIRLLLPMLCIFPYLQESYYDDTLIIFLENADQLIDYLATIAPTQFKYGIAVIYTNKASSGLLRYLKHKNLSEHQ